jgi:capsule polysaccharide export protein KpsE/RkpR
MLTIENSQMQRQSGAAVESFRNEVIDANRRAQISDMIERPNEVRRSPDTPFGLR